MTTTTSNTTSNTTDGGNHQKPNLQVPRSISASYHVESYDGVKITTSAAVYCDTRNIQHKHVESVGKNIHYDIEKSFLTSLRRQFYFQITRYMKNVFHMGISQINTIANTFVNHDNNHIKTHNI